MKSLLPVPAKIPGPTKLVVAALIFAAFFIKSPYVILSPGNPQNILGPAITISGTKIYPTTGKLSVTSVMVTYPDSYMTGFDVLYAWMMYTCMHACTCVNIPQFIQDMCVFI